MQFRMLQGLYTSASPNLYPSYHSLIASIISGWQDSSTSPFTSSSVNPNASPMSSLKTLFT